MPSPFPGMNPYLEQPEVWHDFHQRLVVAISDQLTASTRPGYSVRLEERVYVHDLPDDERRYLGRPDVTIALQAHRRRGEAVAASGGAALAEADEVATLPPDQASIRIPRLELRDRRGGGLVTVIELLSPTNKYHGQDRETYLIKRRAILHSPVHLVEIDLLRRGERMPFEDLPSCDYCVTVSRAEERPKVGAYLARLRDPLPTVPIPLRSPDPDVPLDLMAALHTVYDRAGYVDYLYDAGPVPPLHPEDAAWAERIVRDELQREAEAR